MKTEYLCSTLKEIISQTDLFFVSLSSKTYISLTSYFFLCTGEKMHLAKISYTTIGV